jgi:AcrR family transcriptional regulator
MEDLSSNEAAGAEPEINDAGGLSHRQERTLLAVIAHPTLREAAQAAGVSEPTLWRYIRDKDFARRLREARGASLTCANAQLQGAAGEAVKILRDLMSKGDAPVPSRVSAARAILELAFRARVVDELQAEVERLKEIVGEEQDEAGDERGRD